jgi:hypothetical protein
MVIAVNRRRALLVLVAFLALADLAGVAVLREAWIARHDMTAHPERPAARVQPVDVTPGSELFVARTGN